MLSFPLEFFKKNILLFENWKKFFGTSMPIPTRVNTSFPTNRCGLMRWLRAWKILILASVCDGWDRRRYDMPMGLSIPELRIWRREWNCWRGRQWLERRINSHSLLFAKTRGKTSEVFLMTNPCSWTNRSFENAGEILEYEEAMINTFKILRLDAKSISHLLSAVKRFVRSINYPNSS